MNYMSLMAVIKSWFETHNRWWFIN